MRRSCLWTYGLHALVLVGLAVAAFKYLKAADLDVLREFDWRYVPWILGLSLASLVVKGWRFARQVRDAPGVPEWVLLEGYVVSQACAVLPGSRAVRAKLLEQAGVPAEATAASTAVADLADQVVMIGASLAAALRSEVARGPALIVVGGLVLLGLLLGPRGSRDWLRSRMEAMAERLRMQAFWHGFQESLGRVWNAPDLLIAVGAGLLAFLPMVAALALCTRGLGGRPPLSLLLLACSLPALIAGFTRVPGGMGVTEAGMIVLLDTAARVSRHQAIGATLLFRASTLFFLAFLGGAVYLAAWRRRAAAPRRAPMV